MDCNTPGSPVLHYLLESAQTHVHCVHNVIQSSHPLLPPSPLTLNLSTIPERKECFGGTEHPEVMSNWLRSQIEDNPRDLSMGQFEHQQGCNGLKYMKYKPGFFCFVFSPASCGQWDMFFHQGNLWSCRTCGPCRNLQSLWIPAGSLNPWTTREVLENSSLCWKLINTGKESSIKYWSCFSYTSKELGGEILL